MLRSRRWAASLAVLALAPLVGCPIGNPTDTRIEFFTASHATLVRGAEVTLSWKATNPGTHQDQASCTVARRIDGRSADEPVEVPCEGVLTEAPDAPAEADFVRYQLNVLKRTFSAGDAYLTRTITVSFEDEPTTPRVVAIAIDQADATLVVGETLALTATVEVEGGADAGVGWSSSQPVVATIDGAGRLEAHAPGNATITVTSTFDASKRASIAATVLAPPGAVHWTRQLGSTWLEEVTDLTLDPLGNVVVAGYTLGDFGGANLGAEDAFALKLGPTGQTSWVRQLGTADRDLAFAVAADGAGNLLVAGATHGNLAATNLGGADAFVSKLDAGGNVLWTRQFGTASADEIGGVATDAAGNVIVAGSTSGDLAGPNAGAGDAFVRKYDANGLELWTRQFGTGAGDWATDVETDAAGNVLLVGGTHGDLAAANAGGTDVFVRKYDPGGNVLWTRQFGTSEDDAGARVAVGAVTVAVVGDTRGSLEGVGAGNVDAFVRVYDLDGIERWTRQIGTAGIDTGIAVAVAGGGHVVVGGRTAGTLGDFTHGGWDGYVRKFDVLGDVLWTRQAGTYRADFVAGVAIRPTGEVVVAGSTEGDLEEELGYRDVFVREYGP